MSLKRTNRATNKPYARQNHFSPLFTCQKDFLITVVPNSIRLDHKTQPKQPTNHNSKGKLCNHTLRTLETKNSSVNGGKTKNSRHTWEDSPSTCFKTRCTMFAFPNKNNKQRNGLSENLLTSSWNFCIILELLVIEKCHGFFHFHGYTLKSFTAGFARAVNCEEEKNENNVYHQVAR